MKPIYRLIAFLVIALSGCVRDPNEYVDVNTIGEIYFSSSQDFLWPADSTVCWEADIERKIPLSLQLMKETENGKTVTFRVTHGTLVPSTNISQSTTQSQDVVVVNKRATVYYVPDSKQNSNCLLTASIEGVILSRMFCLLPSYPDSIFLQPSSFTPTAGDDINVVAWLDKNNGTVSENIKVYFTSTTLSGSIITHAEHPYIMSTLDNQVIKATNKIITDNDSTGTVELTAWIDLGTILKRTSDTIIYH